MSIASDYLIDNVNLSEISEGEKISKGDVIGYPTDNKHCGDIDNQQSSTSYIHFQIAIKYDKYKSIAPELLIE